MIVKVQLSLESSAPGHKPGSVMLVYNKSGSIMFQKEADEATVKKMQGRMKDFFHAIQEPDGTVSIQDQAPWQDW